MTDNNMTDNNMTDNNIDVFGNSSLKQSQDSGLTKIKPMEGDVNSDTETGQLSGVFFRFKENACIAIIDIDKLKELEVRRELKEFYERH